MKYVKLFEQFVNEAKIKWNGKRYQKDGPWTVYAMSDSIQFNIKVNSSAGWSTDVHDSRNETFKLMDGGKTRATLRFTEGNIQAFADKMFKLNDETTWGEKEGLTSKDYADIIRVWIDMQKILNENLMEGSTQVTPESDVVVDDYLMDDAETTIKSTEIVGAIVSSETEKDFKQYFYDTYGNTAFTENDIQSLVKYYNEYKEEKNAEETEKEEEEKKKEEGGGEGDDPLAGLDI